MVRGRIACGCVLISAIACNRETLDVAPEVDLDRFQGRWYEVAHLARSTQSDCTGTTATYTLRSDGKLAFVHECTLASGAYHGATAIAEVRDRKTPAKLEVDFGGHVGDYWIVEVGPDYRYAVVGHPSRDYLWILSRTPSMDGQDLDSALAHAKDKSFDTNRLEYTPKGPEPQGTPEPPVTYGCGATPAPLTGFGPSLLFAGALLWLRRRRTSKRRARLS